MSLPSDARGLSGDSAPRPRPNPWPVRCRGDVCGDSRRRLGAERQPDSVEKATRDAVEAGTAANQDPAGVTTSKRRVRRSRGRRARRDRIPTGYAIWPSPQESRREASASSSRLRAERRPRRLRAQPRGILRRRRSVRKNDGEVVGLPKQARQWRPLRPLPLVPRFCRMSGTECDEASHTREARIPSCLATP